MSILSLQQYNQEVQSLAKAIVQDVLDSLDIEGLQPEQVQDLFDENLYDTTHEAIDSHEYIIYTAYHLPILQYSDNANYMVEELGNEIAGEVFHDKGLDGLHQALAYWAMLADTQEAIHELQDDIEEKIQELAEQLEQGEE